MSAVHVCPRCAGCFADSPFLAGTVCRPCFVRTFIEPPGPWQQRVLAGIMLLTFGFLVALLVP